MSSTLETVIWLSAIVVITLLSLIYLDVSETKDAVIKFTEQFEYVIEE